MKVRVLKKDIERAKKYYGENHGEGENEHCPLALALKRKTHKRCMVNPNEELFDTNLRRNFGAIWVDHKVFPMSKTAREVADKFDEDRFFKPGWYELTEENNES